MANPWFRLYAEFAHDPKVQMLSETMQRRYIMLMCLRCSNVLETLQETEIAFYLRITDEQLAEMKALFIARGFIDQHWNLANWDKRQFASDSSAARVARHRAKKRDTGNADVTLQQRQSNAPDTDTDTDTEEKDLPDRPPSDGRSKVSSKKPGAKLPKGFEVFWAAYPRKEGKLAAAKAFERAVKLVEHPHPTEALAEAAQAFAKACVGKDPQYIAHPTTWLNQGRWADVPTTPSDPRQQALASGMWNGRPLTATERYMLENNPSYLPMAAGGG